MQSTISQKQLSSFLSIIFDIPYKCTVKSTRISKAKLFYKRIAWLDVAFLFVKLKRFDEFC